MRGRLRGAGLLVVVVPVAADAGSVRAWVGGRVVGWSRACRALTRGGVKCLRRGIDSFGVRGAKSAARRGRAWAAADSSKRE